MDQPLSLLAIGYPGVIPNGRRDFPVKARSSPKRHPLKVALADRAWQ